MAGLGEQPMAAGTVETNGVATTRETLARKQVAGQGAGAYSVLPWIALVVVGAALGNWASSPFEGVLKLIIFATIIVLPVGAILWVKKRFALRKLARAIADQPVRESKRLEVSDKAVAEAKARGDFARFGKDDAP